MHTSLDPEVLDVVQEPQHNEYGPSDTSDSASDVVGTASEATDSDANGTGERQSVDFNAPTQTEQDVPVDGAPKFDSEIDQDGALGQDVPELDEVNDEDIEDEEKSPRVPR